MGANRKLKRAQVAKTTGRGGAPRPAASRDALRRQSSAERFKRPGSDTLWARLLGWEAERVERIRLADAIHDGVLWKRAPAAAGVPEFDPAGVIAAFAAHSPAGAARLDTDTIDDAVNAWISSGDQYDAGAPAPKWSALATLCERAGLGKPDAAALQNDWEAWTSLHLVAPGRTVLLELLKQAEQAAVSVNDAARSETFEAIAVALRTAWSAVAYGDRDAILRLRRVLPGEEP